MNNKNKVIKMSREWHTLEHTLNPTNGTVWIRPDRVPHIQPTSSDGRTFWQTTTVFILMLCAAILYICFSLAGYWLESIYQIWISLCQLFFQFTFFGWSFFKIWLKTVYQKNICRRYLFRLCICLLSISYIVVIIYLLSYILLFIYWGYVISSGDVLVLD